MKVLSLTLAAFFSMAVFFSGHALANFPVTPGPGTVGSLCTTNDSDFVEYRYSGKIPYCQRNVSTYDKKKIYDYYGVPEHCRKEYTIDHFIPLSLGGTNRADNLWPEAKVVKHTRQNLELQLFDELRKGTISQADALAEIREAKLNPPIADPAKLQFCL